MVLLCECTECDVCFVSKVFLHGPQPYTQLIVALLIFLGVFLLLVCIDIIVQVVGENVF